MSIVRDGMILGRIGVGQDEWLVSDEGCPSEEQQDTSSIDSSVIDCEEDELIDNLWCDADFDMVDDGYSGQDGVLRGSIRRMRKSRFDRYSACTGIYSSDGMYMMESSRGVAVYPGRNGRAQCIAMPQCKMMNSTVLDGEHVRQTVYVGEALMGLSGTNGCLGASGLKSGGDRWLAAMGFGASGTHVPFDLWCIVGVVFGKALRVWRGVAKMDMSRMPTWMYVEIPEVFETLNPGCQWADLSVNSRTEWMHSIGDAFSKLRGIGMAWDLPDGNGGRNAFWTRSILESTWVRRRVDAADEASCRLEWGDVYEPCGFKVRLRGNMVFDFCWRRGLNSPSVVQIRRYEHDVRKVLGTRGWTRCFHMIWLSWLVQYRNYWKRRNGGYATCELEWSQREMLRAFSGGVFEVRHLSTDEMVRMLTYHTQRYVFEHSERRPAHIDEVFVLRRCVVGWSLPKSLAGESVLVKNDAGMNMSLEDSGVASVPAEVRFAESRMREINEANAEHVVTLDGRRLDTSESVIYREEKVNGSMEIVSDRNGRCYSMRGGVQCLGKAERGNVLIDGGRVREVDYSGLHPNMLYALNGIQFNGDIYDVGRWYLKWGMDREEARRAVKMMMMRMINARSNAIAMYSFKKGWNEEKGLDGKAYIPWMYELRDAILRRHVAIAHEFCSGKGVYLMNIDGKLIREVCHRLARERICALAVHDSVIVGSRYAEKAAGIMRDEYSKMFNGMGIKVKF